MISNGAKTLLQSAEQRRPLNLLFVNPTFRKWGGVEEVIVMLAEHFSALGHRIVIASEDTPETLAGRFAADVRHHPLALRRQAPVPVLRNFCGLLEVARREKIDLISAHQKKVTALCVPVGRLLGIPVVHTAHNQMGDWRARWFGVFGKHVTANCSTTKEYLIRRFRVPRDRITVIHSTARVSPPPSSEEIDSVRAEFGLTPNQPVLVCVARLSDEKGHSVLLRAMPVIRAEFPEVRLIIVGKGHLRHQLEELSASLGLTECVKFAGYRREPSAIIAAATVAVLPSFHEAFPLANIECLRLGVPVVCTNVDGVPELIRDGETGILAPPGDVEALARGVCRLLRETDLAAELGRKGRAFALQEFEPSRMCSDFESYFARVLGRPLRPDVGAARVGCPEHRTASVAVPDRIG